jgi:Protein of unknown function (DUF2911)
MLSPGFAQTSGTPATASCTFQDGKQMSIRYESTASEGKQALRIGKLWMPGGQPMWLFTQADLSVANSVIPIGAYSMYILPEKDAWTLILNRNVKTATNYDEHEDLARVAMPIGQLSDAQKELSVLFGHVGPNQCNLRVYYGKTGSWAEFHEK